MVTRDLRTQKAPQFARLRAPEVERVQERSRFACLRGQVDVIGAEEDLHMQATGIQTVCK